MLASHMLLFVLPSTYSSNFSVMFCVSTKADKLCREIVSVSLFYIFYENNSVLLIVQIDNEGDAVW